jgi:hypothetical protein
MMFVVAETVLILILEVRGKFDIFGLCCPEALFVGPFVLLPDVVLVDQEQNKNSNDESVTERV